MFNKLYNNLDIDALDLTDNLIISCIFDHCHINSLILPRSCNEITCYDSIIKHIVILPNMQYMYCDDSGIEELTCSEPCPCVKRFKLADNKLSSFNLQITTQPFEIDIANNNISEIKYKIPFHFDFKDDGNPITKTNQVNYIDLDNY